MKDYILRAITSNKDVRLFAASSKETVNEACKIHNTSPIASIILGRMLTAGAIMGTMLKNKDDLVTISMKGSGPMKGVLVTSDSVARVKGYVNTPIIDIPPKPSGQLDIGSAIGQGYFRVVQDIGLKEPYVGQVPLVSGEVAKDLTYYYAKSEQIPTAAALGVLLDNDSAVKHSGGFILQMMPDADLEIVDKLEKKVLALPPLTELFERGITVEDIVDIILGDVGYKIISKTPVEYYCNCSRERVQKALAAVGKKELVSILKEDKKATLNCHFCNKDYEFSEQQLTNIVMEL